MNIHNELDFSKRFGASGRVISFPLMGPKTTDAPSDLVIKMRMGRTQRISRQITSGEERFIAAIEDFNAGRGDAQRIKDEFGEMAYHLMKGEQIQNDFGLMPLQMQDLLKTQREMLINEGLKATLIVDEALSALPDDSDEFADFIDMAKQRIAMFSSFYRDATKQIIEHVNVHAPHLQFPKH